MYNKGQVIPIVENPDNVYTTEQDEENIEYADW
jgi:hypothetical protein